MELREDVRSGLVDGAHHDHALLSQLVQERDDGQRGARVFSPYMDNIFWEAKNDEHDKQGGARIGAKKRGRRGLDP